MIGLRIKAARKAGNPVPKPSHRADVNYSGKFLMRVPKRLHAEQVAVVRSFEVLLPAASTGLRQNSKALAQQIRTVSRQRITGRRLGQVTGELMQAVERAIRIHLDLR